MGNLAIMTSGSWPRSPPEREPQPSQLADETDACAERRSVDGDHLAVGQMAAVAEHRREVRGRELVDVRRQFDVPHRHTVVVQAPRRLSVMPRRSPAPRRDRWGAR